MPSSPRSQNIFLLCCLQIRLILNALYLNPVGSFDFRRSRQAGTSDDHFLVNLSRDIDPLKKSIEEFEAVKLCQNDER